MKSPAGVKDRVNPPDRPRGRPRSMAARRAILMATHELLAEGGLSSVTIEGIAARAGVGKPTIYRSWPNAQAVAMAALMEGSDTGEWVDARGNHAVEAAAGPDEKPGSALAALRAQ
jgi:AcrR family transcriptional regulator